jgi:hypothetical protein
MPKSQPVRSADFAVSTLIKNHNASATSVAHHMPCGACPNDAKTPKSKGIKASHLDIA